MLGGIILPNGLRVKPYPIEIYDGDLYELPEINRVNFEQQMFASQYVPTDLDSLTKLGIRMGNAIENKDGKENILAISSNMLSGALQKLENFTCKNHAFYCLIKGVKNFSEKEAKKRIRTLLSHGLNSFLTDSICEDVKKKYIPNYIQISQVYTKMEYLVKRS